MITLTDVGALPTTFVIYSCLSFYGDRRGGALPGAWFVRTLQPLGMTEATLRQGLYRLERKGSLRSTRLGRSKLYRFSAAARASIEPGRRKIFQDEAPRWDGAWTIVHLSDDLSGDARDRLTDILEVEGFGALGPTVWLHPHALSGGFADAVRELGVSAHVRWFRGERADAGAASDLTSLWDLASLRSRYLHFLERFRPKLEGRVVSDPRTAFALRLLLVRGFLSIAWDDPELPPELLPADWPGTRARRLARDLYEAFTGPAVAYGDQVLAEVAESDRKVEAFLRAKESEVRELGPGETGPWLPAISTGPI